MTSTQEVPGISMGAGASAATPASAQEIPSLVDEEINISYPKDITDRGRKVDQKIDFQISKYKNVDDLRSTSFGANASFTKDQLNNGNCTDGDIPISPAYGQIQAVAVNNIGNPKLKLGVPIAAQVLVAPTQLVLIENLAYTVKSSDKLKTTFDKYVKSAEQGGRFVRIFGILIQVV
ncbi:hypothetical protein NW762_013278 [Fusarium torreyae]|uniref:Uncharacterized protein n=1 Tax=Fusarium torreyae TaxID=1237075 RepID=A0A9W8RNV9_9HYPO|nr:hypothetical protein NW762_013278 [Fusarium torreyae]